MTRENINGSNKKDYFKTIMEYHSLTDINNMSNSKVKKNNLYINNILNTYKINNENKTFYINSLPKFKRAHNNDFNKFGKTKNLHNNKKHILRNYFIKRSKSNSNINTLIERKTGNKENKEVFNILLNHYPDIDNYKKKNFNQEIKYFVNSIKNELNQNNKIMYCYNQKTIMTPYKIITHSTPHLNEENIYKFNIVAKSKLLSINDIQQENIKHFFNIEQLNNSKRSLSLKNLETVINNKSPKYISDSYSNDNIKKKGIKIYNYKSKKLREIYDELYI